MHDTVTAPTETRFSLPAHISHEAIRPEREYAVLVRSPSGALSAIGPFRAASPIVAYDEHDFFFRGNYRLTGLFPSGKTGQVLIPKGGRAKILFADHTLYEWSEEIAEHVKDVKRAHAERERHVDHDEKY